MRVFKLAAIALALAVAVDATALANERVPGDHWLRYGDPAEAGFDAKRLAAARSAWEALPSSTFLVIADGAVVAAWGDVERRFMCHSVRKSFLTAVYGIYWDRGEIELNQTLADLGIDDQPDPLLETEKRARILDLLKARSGVFHPAAYAGRTDSRPRGSEGPGRYFAYNNWDFNTAAAILMQETKADVFEAFDEHFARPLGMQDWRKSDGYYHYELDKSQYPAYPFRMSARDAARFGLLYARDGKWGDRQILSRHWVRRSSTLYSIDSEIMGYGLMWWVFREPRFARHGMFAALGVGNQMIAALPDSDLVFVNRANTYRGEGTPLEGLLDLIEQVLDARTGAPAADPQLIPLEEAPADLRESTTPLETLAAFDDTWDYPPPTLGLPKRTTVSIEVADGHLIGRSPRSGTFKLYLQPDGWLFEEDSFERYLPVRDDSGELDGIATAITVASGALHAAANDDRRGSKRILRLAGKKSEEPPIAVARALVDLLAGKAKAAERDLETLARDLEAAAVERMVNASGYQLLQGGKAALALPIFELNTRLFPEAYNTWDSLAEAHMTLGHDEQAIRYYEKTLELNSENRSAKEALERLRERSSEG